jgi:hypothetical protein
MEIQSQTQYLTASGTIDGYIVVANASNIAPGAKGTLSDSDSGPIAVRVESVDYGTKTLRLTRDNLYVDLRGYTPSSAAKLYLPHQGVPGDYVPVTGNGIVKDYIVYVSTTGNDGNDGLTAGTAWLTIDKAINNAPAMWTGKNRVYIAAGTYPLARSTLNTGMPIGKDAEPFFLIGVMADSGLGVRSLAAGSTTTSLNVAGNVLVADALCGLRIRFLTGASAGLTRTVSQNTTTTIGFMYPLNSAPLASDTFVIETPATSIQLSQNLYISSNGRSKGSSGAPDYSTSPFIGGGITVGLYALKFVFPISPTVASINAGGGSTILVADSCEFDLGTTPYNLLITTGGSHIGIHSFRYYTQDTGVSYSDISNSTIGTGSYFHGIFPGTDYTVIKSENKGYLRIYFSYLRNVSVDVNSLSYARVYGSKIYGGFISSIDACYVRVDGGTIVDCASVSRGCYTRRSSFSYSDFVVNNATNSGMTCYHGSAFQGKLQGVGNAERGLRLTSGCTVVLDPASTITGTQGDLLIGATASTHANLTSTGFVTDAAFLSRVARAATDNF